MFRGAGLESRARPPAEAGAPAVGDTTLSYFHQIHRDWGWPDAEIEAAAIAIAEVCGKDPLGKTLFLGAGAARLVRELHLRQGASATIALDINPLPFLVARKILDGETVRLTEIPNSPRSIDDVAVERTLGEGLEAVANVTLVFGDAFSPPVARGAFDTVVTAWFVDQVAPDAAELAPLVHALLRENGTWINHGPFVYPAARPVRARYTADELSEIARDSGFDLDSTDIRRLTFMESPACNQGRTERILTFAARKVALAAREETPSAEPAWLSDTSAPIPRLEAFRARPLPHPFFTAVVALVDGARSIDAIAAEISRQQRIPEDALRVAIRACLADLAREGSA